MRDTPPSDQDGQYGYEPDEVDNLEAPGASSKILSGEQAEQIAREAYEGPPAAAAKRLYAALGEEHLDRSFVASRPTG